MDDRAPTELRHLDALRVTASVGIVVFHFGATAFGDLIGRLHLDAFVDVFFVISGAVMHHVYGAAMARPRDYRRFMVKRVARLYPLHLATLGFFVVLGLALAATGSTVNHPEMFNWRSLVPNALLIHDWGLTRDLSFNGPSWSISAEMACYLLFPVFLFVGRRRVLGVACLAIMVGGAIIAAHGGRPWYGRTVDGGVLRAAIGFLLGAWLYGRREALARIPWSAALFWVALVALLAATALPNGAAALLLGYVVAALALAADASGKPLGIVIRRLAPLGALTYSLYLLHPVVQAIALDFAAKRVLHLSGAPMVAAVIASAAVTVAISTASYHYFERTARIWVTQRLLNKTGTPKGAAALAT